MFAVDKFEIMGDDLCFGLVSWKWGSDHWGPSRRFEHRLVGMYD